MQFEKKKNPPRFGKPDRLLSCPIEVAGEEARRVQALDVQRAGGRGHGRAQEQAPIQLPQELRPG